MVDGWLVSCALVRCCSREPLRARLPSMMSEWWIGEVTVLYCMILELVAEGNVRVRARLVSHSRTYMRFSCPCICVF